MARAGLAQGWTCLFANDFDPKKGAIYQANWGTGGELTVGDIRAIMPQTLPGLADLVWGSFPCQDLSLAGSGAGLSGERSGTFYPFWDIITGLIADNRAPKLVVIENVCGTLTSHNGRDFQAICGAFSEAGYRFGAVVINAELFVPQSRPRLFVIGVRDDIEIDPSLVASGSLAPFHTRGLSKAVEGLDEAAKRSWLWWNLPVPPARTLTLSDLIEDNPDDVKWHTKPQTDRLVAMMSATNLAKVKAARQTGQRKVGTIYKRTRPDARDIKVQRAEVRFDDISGCLRTPAGGSSRQTIMVIEDDIIRTRLISARETARLMGLSDSYRLPGRYNEAYHLTGDGIAVPVVRHLAHHLFEPLLEAARPELRVAA